jgi:outer membrane protein TolC
VFLLRGLAVQLVDARETARIQTGLRDLARLRAQRGLGAQSDVARIEADLAQATAEVSRLEAEQQANRRALLVLTGDPAAPTAALPITPLILALPEVPAAIPSELLARRPDVREAQAQLAAATGRLRVDELAFFPRFTLNPGIGLSASSGGFVDAVSAVWTLGAGLTAPILDRPRLVAQLRTQEARVEQAVIAYERAVQTSFSEADQSLVRLAADRRQVSTLRSGADNARRAFDAARILYERGLTDLTALLDAERAYRTARSAATSAEVQTLRRAVQVFKALGGGWDPSSVLPENGGVR